LSAFTFEASVSDMSNFLCLDHFYEQIVSCENNPVVFAEEIAVLSANEFFRVEAFGKAGQICEQFIIFAA
jgi:hypothetical protein